MRVGQPLPQWAQVLARSRDDHVHVAVGVRLVVGPGVAYCRENLGEEWRCDSDCERERGRAYPAPREGRRCRVQVSETVDGRLSHGLHHGCGC